MQGIERREAEAIGTFEKMEQLSHQFRRTGMGCIPGIGDNKEIGTGQLQSSAGHWFVDDNLRASRIDDAAVYQISIDIVKTHGAGVGTSHTPELKLVALPLCYGHIFEAFRRAADDS